MRTFLRLKNQQHHKLPAEFQHEDIRYTEELVAHFLRQFTAPGDTVLDPFAGFGTTLIVWAVTTSETPVPGYWTIPHTAAGKLLVGGPSNAGGLFCDWATRLLAPTAAATEPGRVPVWAPYPRGERTPLHDPFRRGRQRTCRSAQADARPYGSDAPGNDGRARHDDEALTMSGASSGAGSLPGHRFRGQSLRLFGPQTPR